MLLRSVLLRLGKKIGLGILYAFAYAFSLALCLIGVFVGILFIPIICFFTSHPTKQYLQELWLLLKSGVVGKAVKNRTGDKAFTGEGLPWI